MPRLWAFMIALMSPVRPRENGVSGMHWARPPPAALPLMFMVGPPEGWRMAPITDLLALAESLHQAHGAGGLAFAERGGGDGGDVDIFAVGPVLEAFQDFPVVELGDVMAMGQQFFFGQAELLAELVHGFHAAFRLFGDFPVRVFGGVQSHGFLLCKSFSVILIR